MADEIAIVNGVVSSETDDQSAENFYDLDQPENQDKLKQRIESLEHEKLSLLRERDEIKDQLSRLVVIESDMKLRLQTMERDMELSEVDKKAMESVAARALELETEVYRLQHDLISAMSAGDEANAEISSLKKALGKKETILEEANGEKAETEKRLRELERKIGVLELKEQEEKSKKVRIEEEMREQVSDYKKRIEHLESEVAKKEELERKTREMEGHIAELERQAVEAGKLTGRLQERSVQVINGIQVDGREGKGFKLQWPVVAAGSTGAIVAAAAVAYVCYARRK